MEGNTICQEAHHLGGTGQSLRPRSSRRPVPTRAVQHASSTRPGHRPDHVVLVSDRAPVRFTCRAETLVPDMRSSSVTALLYRSARATAHPVTWVAPSTSVDDERAMQRGLFRDLSGRLGFMAQVVSIDKGEYDRYYYDAGVSVIWSAWHGIEDDVPVRCDPDRPLASLASYAQVNREMAVRVAQVAKDGAVVAVQDYQFLLTPAMVRALRPDVRIVHFSHTPFPSAASLAGLPSTVSSGLVNGMLGADLLGFQRPLWAHRFLRCCRMLGFEVDAERGYVRHRGRRTWVRCYPVSVDVPFLTSRSTTPAVLGWAALIRDPERKVCVARVDRLDPAKNALRGFEAYALLLRRRPGLARDVHFVACLVPSREQVPAYQRYRARVRRTIEDVNRGYPGAITVHYGDNQDRAFGVLRRYDVLLVNSVTDGMNLVAQEGSVVNVNDGTLVLSSGAGSADVLSGAVILDRPRDVEATADLLEVALSLSPLERRDRARRLRAAVSGLDAGEWLDRQLADALAVSAGSAPTGPLPRPAGDVAS